MQTYSGYRADEHPLAFTVNSRTRVVSRVVARYSRLHTDGRRFRVFVVSTREGGKFLLEQWLENGEWFAKVLRDHPA